MTVELVFWRRVRSWSRALKEEHRIKSLTHAEKERLLERSLPPVSRPRRS